MCISNDALARLSQGTDEVLNEFGTEESFPRRSTTEDHVWVMFAVRCCCKPLLERRILLEKMLEAQAGSRRDVEVMRQVNKRFIVERLIGRFQMARGRQVHRTFVERLDAKKDGRVQCTCVPLVVGVVD